MRLACCPEAMPRPISFDLRRHVVEANHVGGALLQAVATWFAVGESTLARWMLQRPVTGSTETTPRTVVGLCLTAVLVVAMGCDAARPPAGGGPADGGDESAYAAPGLVVTTFPFDLAEVDERLAGASLEYESDCFGRPPGPYTCVQAVVLHPSSRVALLGGLRDAAWVGRTGPAASRLTADAVIGPAEYVFDPASGLSRTPYWGNSPADHAGLVVGSRHTYGYADASPLPLGPEWYVGVRLPEDGAPTSEGRWRYGWVRFVGQAVRDTSLTSGYRLEAVVHSYALGRRGMVVQAGRRL